MCSAYDVTDSEKVMPRAVDGERASSLTSSTSGSSSDATPQSIFCGRSILAPMVRINSLGFRLLCAEHGGADVVFSEEVVAAKLCRCVREVVTYPSVSDPIAEYTVYEPFMNLFKRTVVFAAPARAESSSLSSCHVSNNTAALVLQLGVCDPDIAASAARLCAVDVDGIDINMGCPKKFSVSNGFGAALMQKTALAGAILRAVHDAVNQPAARQRRSGRSVHISFKTRLQSSAEITYTMLREILVAAGHRTHIRNNSDSSFDARVTPSSVPDTVVHAITLHARTREQRPSSAAMYADAAAVRQMCRNDALFDGVCFVLNGSLLSRHHGTRVAESERFDAAMLARAALLDYSCFSSTHRGQMNGLCEPELMDEETTRRGVASDVARANGVDDGETTYYLDVFKQVLAYAVRYRTPFKNFKYHITRAFPEVAGLKHLMPRVQSSLNSYADCYSFFRLTPEESDVMAACAHEVELFPSIPHAPEHHISGGSDSISMAETTTSTEGDAHENVSLMLPLNDENRFVKRHKRECEAAT